jgi:signal transduction histidine kinase
MTNAAKQPTAIAAEPRPSGGKSLSPVVALVLAIVWVAAVGAWAFSLRVDAAVHDAYSERLRTMIALQHRLNEQVLRKYAGLTGSYDPLVRTMRELRDLHRQAAVVPSFIDAEGVSEVLEQLAESETVLAVQDTAVEQFKTENAILLNSLRYFPIAAAEVGEELAVVPGEEAQVAHIRDLLRDVLRVAVTLTPDALLQVREHVASIRSAIDPSGPSARSLALLLRHADLIIEGRQTVDRLLAEILEQPGADTATALHDAYARHYLLAQGRAQTGVVLFLACVVVAVAGVAASIFVRMRRDAAAIHEASLRVAHAIDRQNRFVSMTSHEFRTPLSVIVSSADLLRAYGDKWGPEQHDKHLARIERAGRGMTELLDGILLIGRTDAGHRDFRPGRVDLGALAHEVVDMQRVRAKGGITIDLVLRGESEPLVADARLIRHVLDNLVANGVKYSKPGGEVRVAVSHADGQVTLTVADDGIGIPLADQEKLFDTFHRAANVGVVQGTGLGLAIVKRAVDLHGGKIAVKSAPDEGTRFDVQIPVSSGDTLISEESNAIDQKGAT